MIYSYHINLNYIYNIYIINLYLYKLKPRPAKHRERGKIAVPLYFEIIPHHFIPHQ